MAITATLPPQGVEEKMPDVSGPLTLPNSGTESVRLRGRMHPVSR